MPLLDDDTIRHVADSIGLRNINKEVCAQILPTVEAHLREIVGEAIKFQRHAQRAKFTTKDIDRALRMLNVEPLYGHKSAEELEIRIIEPYERELYYIANDPVDLLTVKNAKLPLAPIDVTFRAHWLAINGIQPAIPENPVAFENDVKGTTEEKSAADDTGLSKRDILSPAQQKYFADVTKSLTGTHEHFRITSLNSVRSDPGLDQLLPYFMDFIVEKMVEKKQNVFVLLASVRLASAIVNNPNLQASAYLPKLLPGVMSCVLRKSHPDQINPKQATSHWDLRQLAAKLLADMCMQWPKTEAPLEPRVTKLYVRGLLDAKKSPASSYGAVVGIAALGGKSIQTVLLPNLKAYSAILDSLLSADNISEAKRSDAEKVRGQVVHVVTNFLKTLPNPPKSQPTAVKLTNLQIESMGIFGQELEKFVNSSNIKAFQFVGMDRRVSKKQKKDGK
eukprot:CFRG5358T1